VELLIQMLQHRHPALLWQRVTPVTVGCMRKNNSKWCP